MGGDRGAASREVVLSGATRLGERLLGRLSQRQRDWLLAVSLAVLGIGLHLGFDDRAPGALVRLPPWGGVVVLAGMAVALAWRRTHPSEVMSVAGTLTAVYYLGGEASPAGVLVLTFALYAITAYGERRAEGVGSLVACMFFMTWSFVVSGGVASVASANYVLGAFVFGVAWALGDATRTRLELTEELRRRNAQLAVLRERERDDLVADERRRIARELHDVISHTVSVVVVQASAARRVADRDPTAVTDALAAIERAARDAMGELRAMLGLLREDGASVPGSPTPDRAALDGLLDELRGAGMPVRVEGGLPDDAPPGVVLTVHRVVQEALTNVLRHAQDVTDVLVRLGEHDGVLEVEVVDDGTPAGFTEGAGAGLVGVRERVGLHGGSVEAAPLPGRGFRLHATIPTRIRV